MDHACKFDSYMLNREAKQLEHLLTLVDGSHWNSQKKLKHPNSKKGGHLGCRDSKGRLLPEDFIIGWTLI